MNENLYAVSVSLVVPDGIWDKSTQLPSFLVNGDTHALLSEEEVEEFVREKMFRAIVPEGTQIYVAAAKV